MNDRLSLTTSPSTTEAEPASGHCTAPVFTGASSNIAVLSLPDTLPPFPRCTGFPRLGALRRLRPTHGHGRRRAPPTHPRPGWMRVGWNDRRWFPRSLLSGRRVRHPALPLRYRHGYAVDLHHGLPTPASNTGQGVPHLETRRRVRTANQPISAGLELASL